MLNGSAFFFDDLGVKEGRGAGRPASQSERSRSFSASRSAMRASRAGVACSCIGVGGTGKTGGREAGAPRPLLFL